MYKNSIIVFGVVIPLLLIVVVLGGLTLLRSKVNQSYESKVTAFASYEKNRMDALAVEAGVSRDREHLAKWNELLAQETSSLVTTELRKVSQGMPSKEFQQTAFERSTAAGGLASASVQSSSGLKLDFRGTFRSAQKVFLDLETKMPNLQLSELRIDPNTTIESPVLNFQVSYLAWEN